MEVQLIKDYDIESLLLQGTRIRECILADGNYIGIFASNLGKFVVSIPESYCKLIAWS